MSDAGPHEDDLSFRVLDAFLEQLHRGERCDVEQVAKDHPELASALDCLEALDAFLPADLASDAAPVAGEHAGDHAHADDRDATPGSESPTLPPDRSASSTDASVRGGDHADFGQYELFEEIGRGGMGVVFRARQKSLDRVVAIKMISSHGASQEQVRRFRAEARAGAGLAHANVVSVYEVGEVFGQHYFAMEYVPGESLAQRLAAERFDPDAAARLVVAIARAVEHLHQRGVVHRDLKPSNVLLDSDGAPHVTDFGLAKIFTADSRHTATGAIAGTPSYMSPEQAAGEGLGEDVGPASDIYSLGAILYELLTGRSPFQAATPLETLLAVREQPPVLPRHINPTIPRDLEVVCLKCLEKAPSDRYAAAAALADDLERYLKREGVEAQPPSPWRRFWRWGRREPALATRLGAFGVFYLVEWLNVWREVVGWPFHWAVTCVLALWLASSLVFQRLLKSPRWAMPAQFLWGASDVAMMLAVLMLADGVASPMVVGLPLLIVTSGLWRHVRLVWFVTGLCIAAYVGLIVMFYALPVDLRPRFDADYDRHLYFVLALLLFGCVVAHQVGRARTLSRYYESRRN